eukprot:4192747-Amphidinium_carterae.1
MGWISSIRLLMGKSRGSCDEGTEQRNCTMPSARTICTRRAAKAAVKDWLGGLSVRAEVSLGSCTAGK